LKALLALLAQSAPEARLHLMESAVRADLARILGVRESQIDSERPLADLGVDSLMSVELENRVQSALGIDLPMGFMANDNVSLRSLSHRLVDRCQAAMGRFTATAHKEARS
jgi:acyl carrier protein